MLKQIFKLAMFSLYTSFLTSSGLEARENLPCWETSTNDCCDEMERTWFDAEYLYWNIKDSPEKVPLVVASPGPSTDVVLGGKNIKTDWRSGGAFTMGYWFDKSKRLGGEISYLFLPSVSSMKSVISDGLLGSAFLSVPFFNVVTGKEDAANIAFPGSFAGTAKLKLENYMQSAEINVVAAIPFNCSWSFGLLAGFRYWSFYETLSFSTDSPYLPPLADVYVTNDKFHAQNNFYGGQIGAKADYKIGPCFFTLKGKIALGAMHQESTIKGELKTNDFTDFGAVAIYPGGYFALPSNIGTHKGDSFTIIPEVNITFGYEITEALRFHAGYTFLFVNNVLWAGNEISSDINPSQSAAIFFTPTPELVGQKSPRNSLKSSNFWAQGLNIGLEMNF